MDTHSVTTYPVDTAYYYYTNISHFFKPFFIFLSLYPGFARAASTGMTSERKIGVPLPGSLPDGQTRPTYHYY